MQSFEGKVVFITGGAGAIGATMVQKLLENSIKGIAIVDLSEESGIKLLKKLESNFEINKAVFIKADITNKQELEEAFNKTIEIFHQLDIVINNAAVMNENDWEKTINVNISSLIRSTYLAAQTYFPKYKSENEGLIVNIASDLAFQSLKYLPVYSASKHAVVGLGQALGTDEFYEKYKTRVVTLCPGIVNTPLVTEVANSRCLFPEKMKDFLKNAKLDLQTPEHVAQALIKVIKKSNNGSLWIVRKENIFEVVMPKVEDLKTETN